MRFIWPIILFIAGLEIWNRIVLPMDLDADVVGPLIMAVAVIWMVLLLANLRKRLASSEPQDTDKQG